MATTGWLRKEMLTVAFEDCVVKASLVAGPALMRTGVGRDVFDAAAVEAA